MYNLSEAVQQIKAAGAKNVRVVPMAGQPVMTGLYMIEVKQGTNWVGIVDGVTKAVAEGIVTQAVNRVICG